MPKEPTYDPADPSLPTAPDPPAGNEPMRPVVSAAVVQKLAARRLRVLDVFRGSRGPRQAVLCAEAGSDRPSRAAVVEGEEVVAFYPAEDGVKVRFPTGPAVLMGGRGIAAMQWRSLPESDSGWWVLLVLDAQTFVLDQADLADHCWSFRVDPDGRFLAFWSDSGGDVCVNVLDLNADPAVPVHQRGATYYCDGRPHECPFSGGHTDGRRLPERFGPLVGDWLIAGRADSASELH